MNGKFIKIECETLAFISNSGEILDFNDTDEFIRYFKTITGFKPPISFDCTDEEKYALSAIFSKLDENKVRKILLKLLFMYGYHYKSDSHFNESQYHRLIYALDKPNNRTYDIFSFIFHSSSSHYIKSKAKLILEDFRKIMSSNNIDKENDALRSLTMNSDVIVSSICSDILGKKDNPKNSDKKEFNKVIDLLSQSYTKDIGKLITELKSDDETQISNAITLLSKNKLPSNNMLVNDLRDCLKSFKNKKHVNKKLNKLIILLKAIESSLKNSESVINGQVDICKGINKISYWIEQIFEGICYIRNGFDKAHWVGKSNDINTQNYKAEAFLSFNTAAALSEYLISVQEELKINKDIIVVIKINYILLILRFIKRLMWYVILTHMSGNFLFEEV